MDADKRDASQPDSKTGGAEAEAAGGLSPASQRRSRFFHHLSIRLFLLLFGSIVVLLALFTGLVVREHRRHLMATVSLSAGRASDIIRHTTRASMLRSQRTELHEIMQNLGTQPGIDLVRVYNKQGVIMFSTRADELRHQVDLQAEACHRCHAQESPRQVLAGGDAARIFANGDHRVLGWISAIPNAPDCFTAPCHAHPREQTVLGVLDVWMSLDTLDAQMQASSRHMSLMAVAVAAMVALAFAWLILHLVQRPVERLIGATRDVAAGNLEHTIEHGADDDLGDLAQSFNTMTRRLQHARAENRHWAQTLEERVAEKTRELQRAHAHLGQMDRMASLGKLSATVAHEINNPLSGILVSARLVERTLEGGDFSPQSQESMHRSLQMIGSESRRCGEIARNLLAFARTAAPRTESVSLTALLARCLELVRHHLELANITARQERSGEDDFADCSAGEIQQAVLGLLVNAVEAMPSGGMLTLHLRLEPDVIRIAVQDTGVGIAAEILPRIFEPFFTTKSDTSGVGLGLAVVYGIMQRHGGKVEVESKVDAGSTFTLVWPRRAAGPEVPGPGMCGDSRLTEAPEEMRS